MSNTQQSLDLDPVAIAQGHLNRGFKVIPVYFRGKKPRKELGSWQTTEVTAETIPNLFTEKQTNYGGILNDLVDVDLDCPAANFMAKQGVLPHTKMIYGRKSAPMSHHIYKRTEELKPKKYLDLDRKGKCLIEIRTGSGHQSVLPGSTHESGEVVEWCVDQEPTLIEAAKIQQRVGKIAALSFFAERYPAVGSRDEACLHLAGFLIRSGFSVSESDEFIQLVADFNGDEEVGLRLKSQATKTALETGQHVYGIPSLKTFFEISDRQMNEIMDWLGVIQQTKQVEEKFVPIKFKCLNDVNFKTIPKREWLIDKIAQRGECTMIVGPGGTNKTTAASEILLSAAAHKSVFGHHILKHDIKVAFLTNEESEIEVERKLATACLHTNQNKEEVKKRIHYYSGKVNNVNLFCRNEDGEMDTTKVFQNLMEQYKILQPDLIVLDPFATFHQFDENSNSQMTWVMKKFNELMYACNKPAALILIHHAGKNLYINPKNPYNFDKRQAEARGASAITTACRIAFTMGTMNPKVAEDYGVSEESCHHYICFLDSKMNFSDLRAEPIWFEKKLLDLNGEQMVCLKVSDISDHKRTTKQRKEIEKRKVAEELYPFVKKLMNEKNIVLVDKVATTYFNRYDDQIDTTTMGGSISTFKNKIIAMYSAGVYNYCEVGSNPPTYEIKYKYGQQQGEDSKAVHWLVKEEIKKDPSIPF